MPLLIGTSALADPHGNARPSGWRRYRSGWAAPPCRVQTLPAGVAMGASPTRHPGHSCCCCGVVGALRKPERDKRRNGDVTLVGSAVQTSKQTDADQLCGERLYG